MIAEKEPPETSGENKPKTLIRLEEVSRRVGLSRSAIYHSIKCGTFPKMIKITGARASAWIESEIDEFIEKAISDSREK